MFRKEETIFRNKQYCKTSGIRVFRTGYACTCCSFADTSAVCTSGARSALLSSCHVVIGSCKKEESERNNKYTNDTTHNLVELPAGHEAQVVEEFA